MNAPFWWRCFPSFLAGKSKDRGGEKKREKRQKSRLVGRIVVVVESVFSRLMMDGSIVRVATTLRASSSTWPSYRACSVRPTQFTRSYLLVGISQRAERDSQPQRGRRKEQSSYESVKLSDCKGAVCAGLSRGLIDTSSRRRGHRTGSDREYCGSIIYHLPSAVCPAREHAEHCAHHCDHVVGVCQSGAESGACDKEHAASIPSTTAAIATGFRTTTTFATESCVFKLFVDARRRLCICQLCYWRSTLDFFFRRETSNERQRLPIRRRLRR